MGMIQVRHLSVSEEKVAQISAEHIARYTRMIAAADCGRKGIRPNECRDLLVIWHSIHSKGGTDLSVEETRELYDALMDEDDGEPTEVA